MYKQQLHQGLQMQMQKRETANEGKQRKSSANDDSLTTEMAAAARERTGSRRRHVRGGKALLSAEATEPRHGISPEKPRLGH